MKRRWFSGLYGRWADCACSAREIRRFIERFDLDEEEFADEAGSFRTFNDFFSRRLAPRARPLDEAPDAAVFPADGRHLFVPDLSRATHLYAKDQRIDLPRWLDDDALAERFTRGSAVLTRLCPVDCHRFHFPLPGRGGAPRLVDGSLYSVNPVALARRLAYLWRNARFVTQVTDSPAGDYLVLEIGATNVGSVVHTAASDESVEKGEEKGYFRFGGSMIATVFEPGRFEPAADLADQSAAGVELYARLGDRMGTVAR